jgi:hypothetical protein
MRKEQFFQQVMLEKLDLHMPKKVPALPFTNHVTLNTFLTKSQFQKKTIVPVSQDCWKSEHLMSE